MDRPSDCRVHQPLVAIVILHFVLNTFIFANGVFIRHICRVQSFTFFSGGNGAKGYKGTREEIYG